MATVRKKVVRSPEDVLISQRNAQRLIGDPEIISAFEELENAYLDLWAQTAPAEAGKRELAYYAYKAAVDLRALLMRRAQSAKVRDLKLAREAQANG